MKTTTPHLRSVAAALVLAVTACNDPSGVVMLTIVDAPGMPDPDAVRVRVFDGGGPLYGFTTFSAPTPGADGALGTVAVYPARRGDRSLRVQAQGLRGGVVISEGTVRTSVGADQQATAVVRLSAQRPPDGDGDGVPDDLDNCLDAANEDQADADRDGTGDRCATADAGPTGLARPDDGRAPVAADAGGGVAAPDACAGQSCGMRPLGAPCAAAVECASGHCTDGVCCGAADCGGPCRACNRPGSLGTCAALAEDAEPRPGGCPMQSPSSCGRTGKCDGRGECQLYPYGSQCAPPTCRRAREIDASLCDGQGRCVPGDSHACAGRFGCRGDSCAATCASTSECNDVSFCMKGDCRERLPAGSPCESSDQCGTGWCTDGHCCLSPNCAAGAYCGGPGGICINEIRTGSVEPCTAGYMCQSGQCADGVCCESACTGTCRRCNDPSSMGKCVAQASGPDPMAMPACEGPRQCDRGECR